MESPARVKRGGCETPGGYRFELTGGSPCLDLANTVDNRPSDHPVELLTDFGRLVAWGRQAGILSRDQAGHLLRDPDGKAAGKTLRQARALREAIYRIFSARAAGRPVPRSPLAALNAALPGALAGLRIHSSPQGYRLDHREAGIPWLLLGPVVRSAADLLTSPDLDRVRECAAGNCSWLFLDRSRNRSRRWCDMSVCGNRSKARRHYRRNRLGKAS